MNEDISEYNDIIFMPHHISKKHVQMSKEARAAQFAPFAALTGYGDAIKETTRLTEERIEINEEIFKSLNEKMNIIRNKIHLKPKITVTYFVPDMKKTGGKYVTVTGNVQKIDEFNHIIIVNEKKIKIKEIIEIEF